MVASTPAAFWWSAKLISPRETGARRSRARSSCAGDLTPCGTALDNIKMDSADVKAYLRSIRAP
jgi:hypothetical protein